MTQFDPKRWIDILRGAADLMESREKRLEFKERFGVAACNTLFKQLQQRGIDPQLLELIRRDLEL